MKLQFIKNKRKLTATTITLALTLSACSTNSTVKENQKENIDELVYNSLIYKTLDSYEITDTYELDTLNRYNAFTETKKYNGFDDEQQLIYHKKDAYIKKDKVYNEKIRYSLGNLLTADINKISEINDFKNFNNIILVYPTINISPKLDVFYNDVRLILNHENKFDFYGRIIIKNKDLSNEDSEFFKKYSELYPHRLAYNDNFITIRFNIAKEDY